MESWDPHGALRLESISDALVEVNLIDFVRDAAVEVWRANRDRYEPDELFDDPFTLSVLSSRNLANRLWAHLRSSDRWQSAGVRASREHSATVLHLNGVDIRLVKVPHAAGRRPSFTADFDWNGREARLAAASRNHAAYAPSARRPEMEILFEVDQPGAEQAVRACRDVFLVWGAELTSGLTAGWLGLPTTNADHWLAVTSLWWDEPTSTQITTDGNGPLSGEDLAFGHRPVPMPAIALKPRRDEGTSQ